MHKANYSSEPETVDVRKAVGVPCRPWGTTDDSKMDEEKGTRLTCPIKRRSVRGAAAR